MPPDVHHHNAAERANPTSNAHFIAILVGIDGDFPRYLWDTLLP